MNPFTNPIKFSEKKPNHFYAIKNEKGEFLEIKNPKTGHKVYEIPSISGGESKPLILEIPIPLCRKHFDSHDGKRFGVTTCRGWNYIAIPVELGSTICRECKDSLFIPIPFLFSANLRSANLRYADLSYANLRSADLCYADLRSADLKYADLFSANLSSANLSYADLSSADLRYANLRSADLRSADLRYADLFSANLSSANLSYADLRSADLRSANLRSADLKYANLRYANLSSADLCYANLSSADLRSAKNINESINLDKANWNKFTQIDKEYKHLLSKERFIE